jgi:Tannase and feruloyl esterase
MFRLLSLSILFAPQALAGSCESLLGLALPHASVTTARIASTDLIPIPLLKGIPGDFSVCLVDLTAKPTADSLIKVEIWLPTKGWNGKYMAVGNGGWSGAIRRPAMIEALRHGYATSSTDTGHEGSSASFALGHPEKLIDYAYRSEHEMAALSKAIIAEYYDKPQRLSYWKGCSAGGKQGLMEAQQYPADFDGIIAGSPAANWTGRATQAIWSAQAVHSNEASYIPPAKYPAIHQAVLAACDKLDGVEDGVLENPRRCTFDPQVLACTGADGPQCLTPLQVDAARKIYSPSVNPRTHQPLYSGLEKGSELGWATWAGPKPLSIALDYFRFVVFENPAWDFRTLNFDDDIARAEALDAHRINATDPNLAPYFQRGGKLIQYHGWNDPQISPGNSVAYYESVLAKLGSVADSYRLFMVPGMAHCGGGEGPNNFDMIDALEKWVEAKQAPERITAYRMHESKPVRARPLCPYPQVAVYKSSGSPDEAGNFTCGLAATK